jgi:hypothetical protein
MWNGGASGDPREFYTDIPPGPYPVGEICTVQSGVRRPSTIVTWDAVNGWLQVTCPGTTAGAVALIVPPFALGIELRFGVITGAAVVDFG